MAAFCRLEQHTHQAVRAVLRGRISGGCWPVQLILPQQSGLIDI